MKTLMLLSCALVLGCTALMSQTPITESVTLQHPPQTAYRKALQAMAQLGGDITHADAQNGIISAKVHNAVILNVSVEATTEGSRVQATGTLMPNKIVVGSFTEVQEYLALVR